MISAKDVEPAKLVERLKEELKKIEAIQPPEWSKLVKSGRQRERPPEQPDFWYIRAGSILRQLYKRPVGIERLRTYYGGRKNRGHKPSKFFKASGSIIRKIIQQLEKAGLVEKAKKGRTLTGKGRSLMDRLAKEVNG